MELEIEVNVILDSFLAKEIREGLGESLELVAFSAVNKFSIRPKGMVDAEFTIDQAVQEYLVLIEWMGPLLLQASGVVRVGAYYSEAEAAAFSVVLSNTTILMLAKHQFAIDVTCYPCV